MLNLALYNMMNIGFFITTLQGVQRLTLQSSHFSDRIDCIMGPPYVQSPGLVLCICHGLNYVPCHPKLIQLKPSSPHNGMVLGRRAFGW